MTYSTPELLLVGAAQNIVLAGATKLQALNRDFDETYDPNSVISEDAW